MADLLNNLQKLQIDLNQIISALTNLLLQGGLNM